MKKIISLILAIMMLAAIFTGCGSKEPAQEAAAEETAVRNDVIVGMGQEPAALLSCLNASGAVDMMSKHFYDSLITSNGDGTYSPAIASSWEVAEDAQSITFEIRDDIKFHNGDPVTIEDVVFSFNTAIRNGWTDSFTGCMDRMEQVDDTHVVLYFLTPYGPGLECVTMEGCGIFQKAYYEEHGADYYGRNPMGTGPYKFVEWKTGESVSMVANEAYFGEVPAIENVTFKFYSSLSTAAIALENGEIDVLLDPDPVDRARLEGNADLQFDATPAMTVTFAYLSGEGVFAEDLNLRLAVAHAIDKEAVLIATFEGYGELANSVFPYGTLGVDEGYVPPQYDVEKAKEYMAKSNHPDGLALTVQVPSDNKYSKPAEIIQSNLAEIGITLTLEKMETNAWFADVLMMGNYELMPVTFSTSLYDIDYYYEMFTSTGGQNFNKMNDAALDAAFLTNRSSSDAAERLAAAEEAIRIMGDEAYVVPLCTKDQTVCADAALKGVHAVGNGIYCAFDWSWE